MHFANLEIEIFVNKLMNLPKSRTLNLTKFFRYTVLAPTLVSGLTLAHTRMTQTLKSKWSHLAINSGPEVEQPPHQEVLHPPEDFGGKHVVPRAVAKECFQVSPALGDQRVSSFEDPLEPLPEMTSFTR